MELGINTFVDNHPDPHTGVAVDPQQRMADLLEEVQLADEVGLDVFGIGEHHRSEYVASTPAVILAAAAARTKNIRLSSAVTVLSSDDPVRVYQEFATVDLISGGRAEIMAGRGSFIESYPLFGYDLQDYDRLYSEKLDLLLKIREQEKVNWRGTVRPPIDGLGVYPRAVQEPIPVWIAVGGTPESVIRAGTLGLPLAIAIIGGMPASFSQLVNLYNEAVKLAGHDRSKLAVSINVHGFVAEDASKAASDLFPYFSEAMNKVGADRGWSKQTRAQFDTSYSRHGALMLGTPDDIAERIIEQHAALQFDRYTVQMTVGNPPHKDVMRSIELFGTEVAPIVRKALS